MRDIKKQAFHESYREDGTAQLRVVPNPSWHDGDHSHFDNDNEVQQRPSIMVGIVCILAIGVIVTGAFAALVSALYLLHWIINLF